MNHMFHHHSTSADGTLAASHDPVLVAISVIIAVVSAYTALELANRVRTLSGNIRSIWIAGGGFSLGIGIWSMHFTGMLAFNLSAPISYHIPTVALSVLPAVFGSAAVLAIVSDRSLSTLRAVSGAAVAGLAISTMHYTGMAAIRASAVQTYDYVLVALSCIAAIVIAFVALWVLFYLRDENTSFSARKAVAALFLGAAIPVMHYIGMAAVSFSSTELVPDLAWSASIGGLGGLAITLGSMVVLGFSLLMVYVDRLFVSQNEKLAHQAGHDPLTGAVNRFLLEDRLQQAIFFAARARKLVAVMLIDLDGFKRINDNSGHHAGDEVLKETYRRLRRTLRASDTLARMGGDEFLIVLNDISCAADAAVLAQKCLEAVRAPIALEDTAVTISGSIGISLYPDHSEDSELLVKFADAAMYAAKAAGKNKAEVFSIEISAAAKSRNELTGSLASALQNNQFELHYQPQFRSDGSLLGMEALLRWNHPTKGRIPPAAFIALAEELGLIVAIGEWVLKTACRDLSRWRAAGHRDLKLSVNVSALQFAREDWVSTVISTLEATGIPASCLELELTESVVLSDSAGAIRRLQQIRDLGITAAIDDFGTGFSALTYLQDLPIDTLKIDKSFVNRLESTPLGNNNAGVILSTITNLAHQLGLAVVAEGVERPYQLDFLRTIGCDAMQGYLLARPMAVDECDELLRRVSATSSLAQPRSDEAYSYDVNAAVALAGSIPTV